MHSGLAQARPELYTIIATSLHPPPPLPLPPLLLPALLLPLFSPTTDPPEVTPINSTAITHHISLGSELRLSCGYVGVPKVSTQWIHNTTLPLTNGSGSVSIVGGDPGDTEFTIVISSVTQDSGGLYTCNANNTHGSDMATYSVLILSELNDFFT